MGRWRKYTREMLEDAVQKSISFAGVLRILGMKQAGGSQSLVVGRIREYGIDTSHFLGIRANQGKAHVGGNKKKEWQGVLIYRKASDRREKAWRLRRALIDMGRKYECETEGCSVKEVWLGRPLILHVDHLNGDWKDCRPENLKFRCPNCHEQTPNHSNRRGNTLLTGPKNRSRKKK